MPFRKSGMQDYFGKISTFTAFFIANVNDTQFMKSFHLALLYNLRIANVEFRLLIFGSQYGAVLLIYNSRPP